jgi:hypothetical protein
MPVLALILLQQSQDCGIRVALKRFDWITASAQNNRNLKKWDALKQLARYREVIGRDARACAESMQKDELFQERNDASR